MADPISGWNNFFVGQAGTPASLVGWPEWDVHA